MKIGNLKLFKKNSIKSRIAAKTDRLIEQSMVSPHEIDERDLKELDLLVKLDTTREYFKSPIGRWAGIVILFISLFTVSFLIANHLNQTEVEMNLAVSGIDFSSKSDQVFFEAFNVERITISGLKQVTLPATTERGLKTIQKAQNCPLIIVDSSIGNQEAVEKMIRQNGMKAFLVKRGELFDP